MSKSEDVLRVLHDPYVTQILARLHGENARQNATLVVRLAAQLWRLVRGKRLDWPALEPRFSDLYLALDPESGVLCYLLARALRARRIVEFGTSVGISTLYLALAIRDNGGGMVIGTERVPEKAARAREHLREAGLDTYVELREGDALTSLTEIDGSVDLLLNDGFPPYALPVLQLLAPRMRPGAVALCGNAAIFPADHADYLAWVRDRRNGFSSALVAPGKIGEMSVKNGA